MAREAAALPVDPVIDLVPFALSFRLNGDVNGTQCEAIRKSKNELT
jgi:hypothetical protein